MKIKSFLAIAACGLLFAACQTNDGQSVATDHSNAEKADSMLYYFAQMNGAQYDRDAQRDTTLASDEAKKAYIMGVQTGLNAAKEDNDAYNRGLNLGMQMAMTFQQFKKDYGVELNKKVFVKALSEALSHDSIINSSDMQREFYRIMSEFNAQKEERDTKAANENLSKASETLKMKKIADNLYGGVITPAEGEQIKDGDNVDASINVENIEGKAINAPLPSKLKIGSRSLPEPINTALKTMKSGETGKFATSAMSIFGPRAAQMGLQPSDVVILTIKATVTPPEEKK